MPPVLPSTRLIAVKDQIRLDWEEIMGYAESRPALRGLLTM